MTLLNIAIVLLLFLAMALIFKKYWLWREEAPLLHLGLIGFFSFLCVVAGNTIFQKGLIFAETFQRLAYYEAFTEGAGGTWHFVFFGVIVGTLILSTLLWKWLTRKKLRDAINSYGLLRYGLLRGILVVVLVVGLFTILHPIGMNFKGMKIDLMSSIIPSLYKTTHTAVTSSLESVNKLNKQLGTSLNKGEHSVPPGVTEAQERYKTEAEEKKVEVAALQKEEQKPQPPAASQTQEESSGSSWFWPILIIILCFLGLMFILKKKLSKGGQHTNDMSRPQPAAE